MKIKQLPVIRDDPYGGAQQYVVTLSERNVKNLMAQIEMSISAGEGRKAYGSLHKRLDNGDIMVVFIENDEDHYDEEGVAR